MLLKIHYGEKFVACLTGWFSKQNVDALCRRPWFESGPVKLFALFNVHKILKNNYIYVHFLQLTFHMINYFKETVKMFYFFQIELKFRRYINNN